MHTTDIETTDHRIPAEPHGSLWLRNKRLRHREPTHAVMLMHGATFPSASLFDVPVEGASTMDALAMAGLDVWALDARGYGFSTRPTAMSAPAEQHAPLTPALDAAADLARAAAFVRAHRAPAQFSLLGMSWGGSVAGIVAARQPPDHLVLVAPLWLSIERRRIDPGGPIHAWRTVDVRAYEALWRAPIPAEQQNATLPSASFEQWVAATLATDPAPPRPGTVRAPAGAVQDAREHWNAGRPLYDPAAITCPVLIVRAEWDVDVTLAMTADLFGRLTRARHKRWLEIGAGTHMVLMERNRWLALDAITAFLTEAR